MSGTLHQKTPAVMKGSFISIRNTIIKKKIRLIFNFRLTIGI